MVLDNYEQCTCYMSKNQKAKLLCLQRRIIKRYEFKIPTTELIRDAVVQFLNEMNNNELEQYLKQKGII